MSAMTGMLNIASGFATRSHAGKMASIQKERADFFYKENKKEIEKAYDKNYSTMMKGYSDSRLEQVEQMQEVRGNMNIQMAQIGVNTSESSFEVQASKQLDDEFDKNMNQTYENQLSQLGGLIASRYQQDLGNATNMINQKAQATITASKMKAAADQQIIKGTIEVGEAVAAAAAGGMTGGAAGAASGAAKSSSSGSANLGSTNTQSSFDWSKFAFGA